MWFKRILVYRLLEETSLDFTDLEKSIENKRSRACLDQEVSTYGFYPPIGGKDNFLVYSDQGYLLIAGRKEERILPNNVIRQMLEEKIAGKTVYKKEFNRLKEEVIRTLLPRAFIQYSMTHAIICPKQRLILVDSSTVKSAEKLLSSLREALGSLLVQRVALKKPLNLVMTEWLRNYKVSNELDLLDECELRDPYEDGGIIRCKKENLSNEQIQFHLTSGKVVTKLLLKWDNQISFILEDTAIIKRLKLINQLEKEVVGTNGNEESKIYKAENEFREMVMLFEKFIPDLLSALGGEITLPPSTTLA